MHLLLSTPAFTSLHSIWKSCPLPALFPFLGTHFDGDLDPLRSGAGKNLLFLPQQQHEVNARGFLSKAVPPWSSARLPAQLPSW